MSTFQIKMVAVVAMLLDHIAYFFPGRNFIHVNFSLDWKEFSTTFYFLPCEWNKAYSFKEIVYYKTVFGECDHGNFSNRYTS